MDQWRVAEDVAAFLVTEAGRHVRARVGRPGQIGHKSTLNDLVTEVDREVEVLLTEELQRRFPEHAVVGEEFGGDPKHGLVWYIDPIDGTTNFVHGLRGFTISVGLTQAGLPVAGAVYDPLSDELYSAAQGAGVRRNGVAVRVSGATDLGTGLLATGVPSVDPGRTEALNLIPEVAQVCPNIRNLGSAALHLAYVASGILTGYWQETLRPWDAAAGVLLVREAGGMVTDFNGSPWTAVVGGLVASNGHVHRELLHTLRRGRH